MGQLQLAVVNAVKKLQ